MADYQGVLADLRAKLAKLDAERDGLAKAIATIESLMPQQGNLAIHVPAGAISFGGGSWKPRFSGLTLREAVLALLKSVSEPLKTGQIVTALKENGAKSDSKSFGTQVYNTLHSLQESGVVKRPDSTRWVLVRDAA